jgi:hypothetical protein
MLAATDAGLVALLWLLVRAVMNRASDEPRSSDIESSAAPGASSSVGPDRGWRPDNPVFQWGERIGSAILDGVVAPLECGLSASKPIG